MSLILIASERFAEHTTPLGHPERPERAEVMDVVAARWRGRGGEVTPPTPATREQLTRIHDLAHVQRIADTEGRSVAFDSDTYTSPESFEIAMLAAGAAVQAVDRVMSGERAEAFALVRPPGHHAERNRAMGFCLFNNIAVAAAQARASGAGRVAIVDYDVHHGNGTQHVFEADPNVLYVSMHQYPFYPGTGAADEVGVGAGAGFTVNLPLEAGATPDDYQLVFSEVALPVLRRFKPDLVLVSAGFDAHERDPLAGMRLTADAFAAMTLELKQVADECCRGRLVLVTEGGYDLQALARSMEGVINVLDKPPAKAPWPAAGGRTARGRATADLAKRSLAPYWRF